MQFPRPFALALTLLGIAAAGALFYATALACPFCSAVSLTFSEEINNSQVAVIATLVKSPPKGSAADSVAVEKSKFEITKVLKGADELGKVRQIEVVYFGDAQPGTTFLIMGIDPPMINWGTPIAISERGQEYVAKTLDLPKDGPQRLVFFQDFLEDKDEMLARDAYDEFAKAPYAMVVGLKDHMKHDTLVEWCKSTQIPVSRRRLYMTMLGVCGTPADLPMLEEMIRSKDRQTKGALDALVAAYLTIKGPDGMPLVEEMFLKNKDAEYTDTYATIMAIRIIGTELHVIPRERLLEGLRTMLERPQLADLVIPDLARWEDWSAIDRLVELFKKSDDDSSWVRVPVINYLRVCPLPKAKAELEELAKLDPESMKRASSFSPLTGVAAASDKVADKSTDKPAAATADKPATDQAAADKTAATAPASDSKPQPPAADQAAATGGEKTEPATKTAAAGAAATSESSPPQPPSSLPVYGGLAAAAVLFACAFWAILKGGSQAAS